MSGLQTLPVLPDDPGKLQLLLHQIKTAETDPFVNRRQTITAPERTASAALIINDLIFKSVQVIIQKRKLRQIGKSSWLRTNNIFSFPKHQSVNIPEISGITEIFNTTGIPSITGIPNIIGLPSIMNISNIKISSQHIIKVASPSPTITPVSSGISARSLSAS